MIAGQPHRGPLPALRVDAHVHLRAPEGLQDAVAAGVTGLRDAGTKQGTGLSIGTSSKHTSGVVCFSAGWALFKRGGYGALFGVPVLTPDDIASEIQRLRQAGAAIIKVMASGVVSFKEPGSVTSGGFNREELGFIVRRAAQAGLKVMAHANGETAILDAAEAGVASLEHGFFMTERAIEAMARNGVFWVPTVGALARAAHAPAVSEQVRDTVQGLIRSHQKMILHAHARGVLLAIGTDAVLPDPHYGESYDVELAYFEQAGLSPDVVQRIAGEGGATLLGM